MFEVTKAENDIQTTCSTSSSSNHSFPIMKIPSSLSVTIPAELQGISYIMVLCQKGNLINFLFCK